MGQVTRNRLLTLVALVAIALATALLVVVVGWEGGGGKETISPLPPGDVPTEPGDGQVATAGDPPAIAGRAVIRPRIALFGDTVTARIELVLDTARVDPESLRVNASFSPWEIVGDPMQTRRDAGSSTALVSTYVLRCLTDACVPGGETIQVEFDPARVTFARVRGGGDPGAQDTLRLDWPVLAVYSRYASSSFEGRAALTTPWRAELVTFPAASHPVPPAVLLAILVGGAVLLALAGAALAYVVWPRRVVAPPPEPEAPPPPRLTPLQQALALLEDAARPDGAKDRRRSLELIAEALDEWGDDDLAGTARVLAWSEHEPAVDETVDLAARVRAELEKEEADLAAAEEGNGRVA